MRIAHKIAILLAVLCAAVGAGDIYSNTSRIRHTPFLMEQRGRQEEESLSWKREYWKSMQHSMRTDQQEDGHVACCPSVQEMVAPKGGKTLSGFYVELYQDSTNTQQFYELSCRPGVEGKPCRFMDTRLYNKSICVQKYSYSYALVRTQPATVMPQRHRREKLKTELQKEKNNFSFPGAGGWSLDYILVRAGCECEIEPPVKFLHKKRHHEKRKRLKKDET